MRVRSTFLAVSVLTAALAACAAQRDGGEGETRPDPVFGETHTVEWGPVVVAPGEEGTRCVVKRLGNDHPIKVGQFVNQLGSASHHLIVYRYAEGDENLEPQPCNPFADVFSPLEAAPLAITQKDMETITLPRGVAYSLGENQLVRLEMHFINTGSEPIEVRATSTFYEIPEEHFELGADFLFVGNPDVEIPPMSEWTLGPSYLPLPPELAGIHVFAITGHEHRLGTGVEVSVAEDEDDSGDDQVVYDPDPFLWSEPETVYHEPPLSMPGDGGFRFTCSYYNDSTETVSFGESASDEMCFFWAYYYPSVGPKLCVHSDAYNVDLCCPSSNPLCDLLEDM